MTEIQEVYVPKKLIDALLKTVGEDQDGDSLIVVFPFTNSKNPEPFMDEDFGGSFSGFVFRPEKSKSKLKKPRTKKKKAASRG